MMFYFSATLSSFRVCTELNDDTHFPRRNIFLKGGLRKKLFLSFLSQTHKKPQKNPKNSSPLEFWIPKKKLSILIIQCPAPSS